jgi:molybdopterin converting factor small subunit
MESQPIRVEVHYYGALALYAGASQITLELPPAATLRALLDRLAEINPPAYRDLVAGGGFLRVMHNETLVPADGLEAPLAEGDTVALVPAISGG